MGEGLQNGVQVTTDTSSNPTGTPIIGTAGGFDLIDYSEMMARLMAEHPTLSRHFIEAIAVREHEAMLGAMLLAVPAALEDGVREQLVRSDAGEVAA
ncbi:hypothetical protein [Desertivibrio insolitus]|uniref:hypothetical protein n=1 Tax=Herbiconiux sp. SYSU D00978 TaxID=2812562 RepID=UPI001A97CB72|nr:hypothetical protein [Herbiconiux sp. SYSU D00978]